VVGADSATNKDRPSQPTEAKETTMKTSHLIAALAVSFAASGAALAQEATYEYPQATVSAKTRAQVQAELFAARADGSIKAWSISYNPLALAKSELSREAVKAQLATPVCPTPCWRGQRFVRAVASAARPAPGAVFALGAQVSRAAPACRAPASRIPGDGHPREFVRCRRPQWRRQVQPRQGAAGTGFTAGRVGVAHHTQRRAGRKCTAANTGSSAERAFRAMVKRGEFFEWAEVHGNLYGTSRKAIEDRLANGDDVVLEIDWQGALQIKKLFAHAVLIFILAPSWEELAQRLTGAARTTPR
jgi:hypothetical protein